MGDEVTKGEWLKNLNLNQITSCDEVHMNLALTIARVKSEHFKRLGNINDYCVNVSRWG